MDRSDDSIGCWGILAIVVSLVWAYSIALSLLNTPGAPHLWWHYFIAVPLAALGWCLYYLEPVQAVFTRLLVLLVVPVGAVAGSIYLLQRNQALAMAGAGAVLFVTGLVFGGLAMRRDSPELALNSLTARLFGVLMVIAGLLVHFI